jgi:hypothetical protein
MAVGAPSPNTTTLLSSAAITSRASVVSNTTVPLPDCAETRAPAGMVAARSAGFAVKIRSTIAGRGGRSCSPSSSANLT